MHPLRFVSGRSPNSGKICAVFPVLRAVHPKLPNRRTNNAICARDHHIEHHRTTRKRRCTVAQAVVHVDSSQSHLKETVSWAECVPARYTRIRESLLAYVQPSQTTGRTRSTRREKYARFVLEVQRVRTREPRYERTRNETPGVALLPPKMFAQGSGSSRFPAGSLSPRTRLSSPFPHPQLDLFVARVRAKFSDRLLGDAFMLQAGCTAGTSFGASEPVAFFDVFDDVSVSHRWAASSIGRAADS